jgi:hypothetical protein
MTKSGYTNAAFRSSRNNEAYFFINDKLLLLDYAPGTSNDKILYGPVLVRHGFPSLDNTKFGSYGIDCAFDTDNDEAFVFYQSLCAKIDYAPHTDKDKIISGPMQIAEMFPFLEGTGFEHGIDAAFRSTLNKEVYLFRGDKYARIDYGTNSLVQIIRDISDGFTCFKDTIFEKGIDAAFASHISNEAYLFKGDNFVRISFTPGESHDVIMGGVRQTRDVWKSLQDIIPLKN